MGLGDGLDSVSVLAEVDAMARERRNPLLSRGQFCERYGLTLNELTLLLRRADFVASCCLTTGSGEVTRFLGGRFERWLEGREETASAAARQPSWVSVGAVIAQAYLRAVRRPGGLEEVA